MEAVSIQAAGTVSRRVWAIVAVLFLCTFLVQGFALGGIVVYDDRIVKALQVSRGAFKFRDLVYLLSTATSCLFMAPLVARFGVRAVITAGLLAMSCVMLGYAHVSELVQVYLLQALLGFSYGCTHVVVLMIILSRWFGHTDPKRGIAMGICVSGASCGAIFIAQLVARLLAHMPWRDTFPILACLPVVVIPLVWLVIRTPEDAQRGQWRISTDGAPGFSFKLFWRRSTAILMAALVPVFYVSACIAGHAVLMLRDRGLSTATAAAGVGLFFSFGLIGKFGSGFLLLRLSLERAWLLLMGAMLAGMLLLTFLPTQAYMAGLALVGLGWGGCFPLAQLKIGASYPGPALAQVLGLFVFFESFGSSAGAWFTGLMYDGFGGYTVPFAINCALLVGGIAASILEARMRLRQTDQSIQTSTV